MPAFRRFGCDTAVFVLGVLFSIGFVLLACSFRLFIIATACVFVWMFLVNYNCSLHLHSMLKSWYVYSISFSSVF